MYIYVVIPVYNAEKYLKESVYSILNQEYKKINIILVNDGSSDGSGEICDILAKKESRVNVIHQENQGVSAARNAGIDYIINNAGAVNYVAFLDADDLWIKNTINFELIEKIQIENADIVGFSMVSSNPKASRVCVSGKYKDEIIDFKAKYQTEILWARGSFATHFYHINLLIKDNIRFDVDCKRNEDVIFSAKCFFCASKMMFFEKYLYVYRKNRKSVTSTNEYTLENITHIPDAWYYSRKWFDTYVNIPDEAKKNWKDFCVYVSSLRCLEMIRILAEQGYAVSDIYKCFEDRECFSNITNLSEDKMTSWLKPDLIRFKKGFEDYCFFYQARRRGNYIKKKIKSLRCVQYMIDHLRYRIALDKIIATQTERE